MTIPKFSAHQSLGNSSRVYKVSFLPQGDNFVVAQGRNYGECLQHCKEEYFTCTDYCRDNEPGNGECMDDCRESRKECDDDCKE